MFTLEKKYADEMMSHATSDAPNECCGILAGKHGRVTRLYRTRNTDASPVHYNIDPKELLHICGEIDEKDWELLGIYHSHTHTEAYPSPTDVRLALWPDSVYFIISTKDEKKPIIRAFRINEGTISEEELKVA